MLALLLLLSLQAAAEPFSAFDHVWSRRPVVLVGLGDSVTRGVGASSGHSYFDLLTERAEEDDPGFPTLSQVFPQLRVENLSACGSTSKNLELRQMGLISQHDRSTLGLVVMTTGGNDLIHWYGWGSPEECAMYGATLEEAGPWIEAFGERLERVLNVLKGRFPGGCEVFIANLYDPTDGQGDIQNADTFFSLPAWPEGQQILARYNEVITQFATRHPEVHLVDIQQPFMGHALHHGQEAFWFSDLEHPNDQGHAAMGRAFLEAMGRTSERFR